jgi:hypothetical protein
VRTRATVVAGALLACGYLAVAIVTSQVSGRAVLPLYEGVGPAPNYQWVNPPAVFKTGNVTPKPVTETIAVGAKGNKTAAVSSQDTQFIVTVNAGGIPARSGSPSALMTITPLDPATLSALPGGVRADGNAYRMTVVYNPDNVPLSSFASSASIVLSVPLPGNRGVYFSPDGKSWNRVAGPAPTSQPNTIGAQSRDTGIFLAGTTHRATASSGGGGGTSIVTVIVGVLVGIVLVGGAGWFLLRLLRPGRPPARPAARPAAKSTAKSGQNRRPPPRRR